MNATTAFISRYIANHNITKYRFCEMLNISRQTLHNMEKLKRCERRFVNDLINLVCLTKEEELLIWLDFGYFHPEMVDKLRFNSIKFIKFLESL